MSTSLQIRDQICSLLARCKHIKKIKTDPNLPRLAIVTFDDDFRLGVVVSPGALHNFHTYIPSKSDELQHESNYAMKYYDAMPHIKMDDLLWEINRMKIPETRTTPCKHPEYVKWM